MNIDLNSRDITYSQDGDFLLSETGGLRFSGIENDELLTQIIYRRLSHTTGDWDTIRSVTANLDTYIGLEPTTINASLILSVVVNTLTSFGLLSIEDIIASTPAVIDNQVFISLFVKGSDKSKALNLSLVYDTRDHDYAVKFIDIKAVWYGQLL